MALTEKLTNIADAIRVKTGKEDLLTLDAMAAEVEGMTVEDGSFRTVIEKTAVNPTIPSDLTYIGQYAFSYCVNLALTSLPEGITSIGQYAFTGCNNLALTSLPEGITSIAYRAFEDCKKLAIDTLPIGIKTLTNYAFENCVNIKDMTFKGKPENIGANAFKGCSNLTTINVPWAEGEVANAPWGATNATINYNYTGE